MSDESWREEVRDLLAQSALPTEVQVRRADKLIKLGLVSPTDEVELEAFKLEHALQLLLDTIQGKRRARTYSLADIASGLDTFHRPGVWTNGNYCMGGTRVMANEPRLPIGSKATRLRFDRTDPDSITLTLGETVKARAGRGWTYECLPGDVKVTAALATWLALQRRINRVLVR